MRFNGSLNKFPSAICYVKLLVSGYWPDADLNPRNLVLNATFRGYCTATGKCDPNSAVNRRNRIVATLYRVKTDGNPTLNLLMWIFKNNLHNIRFATIRLKLLYFSWRNYFHLNRVSTKAEFTNKIPQKMRLTKEYCGFSQNKGHEFHNIFKFCGMTPQIIPTHVFFRPVKYFVENRFRFRKSISTSDFTNRIRTFFVKFRYVNSAFANTLIPAQLFWNCMWNEIHPRIFQTIQPYTIPARTYLRTASTLRGLQTLDPFIIRACTRIRICVLHIH